MIGLPRHASSALGILLALSCAALTAGCSGGNGLDSILEPPVPNAYLVTTQPPLAIPPSLNTLPPPEPGVARPQAVSPRLQAEETLVPQVALSGTAASGSPGQQALIAAAGPPPPPNLDELIAQQTSRDRPSQGVLSWLLFWQSTPPAGVVVDPVKEARRLQEDAALGRPPTYGQTPIIQPKNQGLF